jgi:hypothetical protein
MVSLTAAAANAQSPAKGKSPAAPAKAWTLGRTPDGQPDLQGVWANNNITPLERPKAWEGKPTLTDQELADVKKAVAEIVSNDGDAQFGDGLINAAINKMKNPGSYDPSTGNYNQFWLVDRDFPDNRTSLVTDPADGKIPAMTPQALKQIADQREHEKNHPADGPEDRSLGERCVNFTVPRLSPGYNSYFQIIQSPTHVAIIAEMAHDARIVPLDGRAPLNRDVQQWNGSGRAHWEGNTLVVETANFSKDSEFRGVSQAGVKMTERFTRVGADTLNWEVTINDPNTYAKPWTVMIPLKGKAEQVFEYACHEGNEGMFGTLSGHRAAEREAAQAAKKGSN